MKNMISDFSQDMKNNSRKNNLNSQKEKNEDGKKSNNLLK